MHVNYDLRSVTLTAGFVLSSESLKRFEFCGIRLYIKLYIENNNSKDLCVQLRDFSINNFMISPIFSSNIAAGMKINDEIVVHVSDLKKNNISNIKSIETKLNIFEWKVSGTNIKTEPIKIITDYHVNARS